MASKLFFIPILFIFGVEAYSQVLKRLPEKEQSDIDFVFLSLEKFSTDEITINQVENLLDSLAKDSIIKSEGKIKTIRLTQKGDTIYSIGDEIHGGIVFWVNENGIHGLVASPNDLTGGVTWYPGITRTLKDGVYSGKYNTEQLIANKSVGYYAAKICSEFKGGGFEDWYLPSLFELNLLYQNRRIIGGFYRDYYWSSSEDLGDVAWLIYFYSGFKCSYHAYGTRIYRVRPIRAF